MSLIERDKDDSLKMDSLLVSRFRQGAHRIQSSGVVRCGFLCPGGQSCICIGDVEHSLHICHFRDCFCHTSERYQHE